MAAAGLDGVPYHVNLMSFGDWGFTIASPGLKATELRKRLEEVREYPVPTDTINPALFKGGMLTFSNNTLVSPNTDISRLGDPRIFDAYKRASWNE